ncbi:MAG: GHKL domain-containing protein [Ruminococcus sp.]
MNEKLKKETPIPSRLRGRGVEVSKTLFREEIILKADIQEPRERIKCIMVIGTHSIRYLAEKYDGDVQMNGENGIFMVDIMIPKK